MSKPAAITAEHLTYIRNGDLLFDDFSFSIPAGAYVAVIGPNGGGKTTLLHVLLGLIQPTSGEVRLFGSPASDPSARQRVGYVPQRGGLLDANFPATAQEVVEAGRIQALGIWKQFGPKDAKIVARCFETLSIEHLRERTMSSLSGGERQRVLLARALAGEPDILALDEPLDGLDPASREAFYDSLKTLNRAGTTIIFITHDVHRIVREASAAICLRHELVCHGTKACLVSGRAMRNLYHPSHASLEEHAA